MARRKKTELIRRFILENLDKHPRNIVTATAEAFKISRQAVYRHLRNLIKEGLVESTGTTKNKTYRPASLTEIKFPRPIKPDLQEDVIWRQSIHPALWMLPKNIYDICNHGFCEILNNAIDHSEGKMVYINVQLTVAKVNISVRDDGVGIFRKIQHAHGLEDQRHAILELSKGKLTTDPAKHSGEGIFFTSRMFDTFRIHSGDMFFSYEEPGDDWLIESGSVDTTGTTVHMNISTTSIRTLQEVYDRFTVDKEGIGDFSKTHVPVSLIRHGNENLVSRSQAKRLLARFDKFKEVLLDFSSVDSIGQAFADEIFRVFRSNHPNINLVWIHANEQVVRMIRRAYLASETHPTMGLAEAIQEAKKAEKEEKKE